MISFFRRRDGRQKKSDVSGASVSLAYSQLEPRQVLNADFTFGAGVLDIDNFVDSNAIANDESIEVRFNAGTNEFEFVLSEGTWFDGGAINTGSAILAINAGALNEVNILDSAAINFDVNFDTVTNLDFSALGNGFDLDNGTGDVTDSGGGNLTFSSLNVQSSGSITLGDDTSFNATQIQFNALGDVQIDEDSDMEIFGNNTADNLTLTSTGSITDEDGSLTSIITTGDATFAATDALVLNNDGNDVLDVSGKATFSGSSINVGPDGTFVAGTLNFNSVGDVTIQEDDATIICDTNTANNLSLSSTDTITDEDGSLTSIITTGDATFMATNAIVLSNDVNDVLNVSGKASFSGSSINVGPDGTFVAGTLNFNSAGDVTIQEDDATIICDTNTANNLSLSSTDTIIDEDGSLTSIVTTGDAAFMATNAIVLNNDVNDVLNVSGKASFSGSSINIGPDGTFVAGTLNFNSVGDVTIQEDDATIICDTNTANNLSLSSTDSITDEDGSLTSIVTTGDVTFTANNAIVLNNDVNDVLNVSGKATFSGSSINVGPDGTFVAGTLNFNSAGDVTIQEDDATIICDTNTANNLSLSSTDSITDEDGSLTSIITTGDATFMATNAIVLSNDVNDVLNVSGKASFSGSSINIGPDGTFVAGTLNFNSAGDVTIQEDDATIICDTNTANNLSLSSTDSIIDEDGSLTSIVTTGDATFTATNAIVLNNDVNDVLNVSGKATFSGSSIDIGPDGTFLAGTLNFNSVGDVTIQEDDATIICDTNTANNLSLSSADSITDEDGSLTSIVTTGDATFTATNAIVLNNDVNDVLNVSGKATFSGSSIDIGPDGTFLAGTLNFNSVGDVTIQEDDATIICDTNTANNLSLSSADSITDEDGSLTSIITTGNATFTATNAIVLNNDVNDVLNVSGKATFSGSSINIGPDGTFLAGTLNFNSVGDVTIQEDDATIICDTNTANNLSLTSADSITDEDGSLTSIITTGDATFMAANAIVLNNDVNDVLNVSGKATFSGSSINVGQDGTFVAGTLNFNSVGDVTIQEDDATIICDTNTANNLSLTSADSITDEDGSLTSIITTGDATFTATNAIVLNNDVNDVLNVSGKATFSGSSINVGQDGTFVAGTFNFNSVGDVTIQEDDATIICDTNTANNLSLTSADSITDEDGSLTSIITTGDATFTATNAIVLNNDVNDVLNVSGKATFSGSSINIGPDGTFVAGTLNFNSVGDVTIQEDDATIICDTSTANNLSLSSADSITDEDGSLTSIITTGDATFTATNAIVLNNDVNDVLNVSGKATFSGSSINVGQDGTFVAGALNFNSAGDVTIQEDDATIICDTNTANNLSLTSTDSITDEDGSLTSIITTGDATFTATNAIVLNNDVNDVLNVSGKATFSGSSIDIGPDGTFLAGTLNFNSAGDVTIQEDDATIICDTNTANNLSLSSTDSITDEDGSLTSIITTGNATFTAANAIVLNNDVNDVLNVAGLASFAGSAINVGSDGTFTAGSLNFNSTGDIVIQEDNSTVLENANTANNLNLSTAGSMTQLMGSSVTTTGNANLMAVNEICLTNPINDFMGTVTAQGSTVEIVDRNALTVGDIMATSDIFLRSGAVEAGLLQLNGNLQTTAADGQVLLQSDSGISQGMLTGISTRDLIVGSSSDTDAMSSGGIVNLIGQNQVENLAADVANQFNLRNLQTLNLSNLTYMSDCGTMSLICGLNVTGDLSLNVTGSLNQDSAIIVGGNTNLVVSLDVCLPGADCTGDGNDDNSFGGMIDVNAGGEVVIGSLGNLNLNNIMGGGQFRFSGADIQINSNIVGVQVVFQATAGVSLNNGFFISTTDLLLQGQGVFDLVTTGTNMIGNLAADITGSLDLNNGISLNVGDLSYVSACGNVAICGVDVSGNLDFDITGNLTQSASIMVGGDANLAATGVICLTGGDCDGDALNDNNFAGTVTAMGATVEIVDTNALTVGNIIANDDIRLVAGDGIVDMAAVARTGLLSINGNLQTDPGGQILLQSDGGVLQSGASSITTDQLILQATTDAMSAGGNWSLTGGNSVSQIATQLEADLIGADIALSLNNLTDLTVSNLQYMSACGSGATVCGLSVDGNFNLTIVDATFRQSADASIYVGGLSDLQVVDGADVNMTRDGDIWLSGGDCDGDGENDNNFAGEVTAHARSIEITDSNRLQVGNITANQDIRLVSGDGLDSAIGVAQTGEIAINGNLTTLDADGQVLLQSDAGVVQAATSTIQTRDLLLQSTTDLLSAPANWNLVGNNQAQFLAASLDVSLVFHNQINVEIAELQFDSNCGYNLMLCGIDIFGDLTIDLDNSDLSQTSAIRVTGLTVLDTGTGTICLAGADCTGDGINDNNLNTLQIIDASIAEVVDRDDLNVVSANVTDRLQLAAGNVDPGQLTLSGNVSAGNQVLLQASNGATQTGGIITTNEVIVQGTGNFDLFQNNQVGTAAVAGRLSANVTGDLAFQNQFGVELTNLSYTTKSGGMISNATFQVGQDLTVFSNHNTGNVIFDSVTVNVGDEAWFAARTAGGNIELDQLNITGAIGVETNAGNAHLENHHANGFIFRGDDQPGVPSTGANFHFETSSVNGNLLVQATAGNITNEANASLTVTQTVDLIAGTSNGASPSGSNNEFNIILGNQTDDFFDLQTAEFNARDASIQLDADVFISNTYVGLFDGVNFNNGTIVLSSTGFIEQIFNGDLIADSSAFISNEYIYLGNLTTDRLAVNAFGSVDVSTLTNVPVDLPTQMTDMFAPRFNGIDGNYGIIVSNLGNLVVGAVQDALGVQNDTQGFLSDDGHVFIETRAFGMEDGDVQFTGTNSLAQIMANGRTFGVVGNVNNNHAITTIANGDLTIDTDSILISSTGAVTDIGAFQTPEGLNGMTITLEGPFMELILPTPNNNPTTNIVGSDNTQFVGLNIGRDGEQRFLLEVFWADGTSEVLDFATDIGPRFERISHVFDPFFLFQTFELPTTMRVFNDPGINLFDSAGGGNLNSVEVNLNTNENFVLARSNSRPQGNLDVAQVDILEPLEIESNSPIAEPVIVAEQINLDYEETVVIADSLVTQLELLFIDEDGKENSIRLISENETVTPDTISKWRGKVNSGAEFPPGHYRLRWTDNGVPFSFDFDKDVQENELQLDDQTSNGESLNLERISDAELQWWRTADESGTSGNDVSPAEGLDVETSEEVLDEPQIDQDIETKQRPSRLGLAAGLMAFAMTRQKSKKPVSKDATTESQANQKSPTKSTDLSFSKRARSRRKLK